MADYSFYGGKQGFSFVLVEHFASIADMVREFKKGPQYTAVHYDEYVLINTKNKNDPDNGKLYRRGYDYTNNMGGAIYHGTIVGPSGRAPMLELATIEEVKQHQATEGFNYRYTEGDYRVPVSLVPGKDGNNYNDVVEWACCCVRNENNEDSTAYIGFKFPYLVLEMTAQSVDAYYHRSNETDTFDNQNLIVRTDDNTHPFYQKYHISVPKGIKGDAFKNFRVIPASTSVQNYEGRADDIAYKRQILVYDYYHYDRYDTGEPVSIYLGDYNMIDSINFDEEGNVRIQYSHDDDLAYPKMFKWIKEVTLNKDNGHFKVTYNHKIDKYGNPTTYETNLNWVNNIVLAQDGTVTVSWSTGENVDLPVALRWVISMEMHTDGTIVVNYNDGTKEVFDKKIQWITKVELLGDGRFTVQYNNGTPEYQTRLTWVTGIIIDPDGTVNIYKNYGLPNPEVYPKLIKYIDYIYFDKEENKFHIVYNTGSDEAVDNIIKYIDHIYLDNDRNNADSDYKIHVVYNTGSDEPVLHPLNYILETAIDPRDYHCLVYYSDADYRQELTDAGLAREYNGKTGWFDLGSVRDDDGILIGLNLKPSEIPGINDITTAISYLNEHYPQGLTDIKMHGKIVTIGEESDNKYFYAFDYSNGDTTTEGYKGWYCLGTFSNEEEWTIVGKADDLDIGLKKSKTAIGGIWFVVEGQNEE